MNTNSNIYTLIYTSAVVVVVAAVLAFVSQKLGPMQAANEKAETVSQILTAAGFGDQDSWKAQGNKAVLQFYRDNIETAFLVDAEGARVADLDGEAVEIYSVSDLKAQNYNIRDGALCRLPVYCFKGGVTVVPVYGAGLWGPVWGYIALQSDGVTIAGAYFDHGSETPGLGGKIKDDPSFRAQFTGKKVCWDEAVRPFAILKKGVAAPDVAEGSFVDAITGATMTSKGLDAAIASWLAVYRPYFTKTVEE